MRYIEGKPRDELRLPSLDELVSEDSIVRLIDAIVQKFYQDNPELLAHPVKGSNDTGRKAYSPLSMMGLLVYCYFNGVAGSRRIEKTTHINVEMMWLMHGLRPCYWTISEFRRENKFSFAMIIMMFRRFAVDNEYADPSEMMFDGSKMKAYASRDMLSEKGILKKLKNAEATIKDFMEGMEAIDSADEELAQILGDTTKAAQDLEVVKKERS